MVRAAAWETLFHYPYFSLEVTIILYYNPNTFRRCDHRSDETLFQGYKFHLTTKSKRRRYRSS